jgi:hypothetical protein
VDDEKLQKIAAELGEDEVLLYRPRWEQICTGAVKLNLHVCYWRAQTALRPEDLGLDGADGEFGEFLAQNVSLGHKKLLPREIWRKLRRIERRARDRLGRDGHPLDLERGAYLVAKATYPALRDFLSKQQAEFYAIRDDIVARRDEIIAEMEAQYRKAAAGAWRIKNGLPLVVEVVTHDDPLPGEEEQARRKARDEEETRRRRAIVAAWNRERGLPEDREVEVPAEFVEEFVAEVVSRIPSAEAIHRSFEFTWRPAYVEAPDELEESKAKAAEIRRRQEIEELKARAERQRVRAQADLEEQKKWAELEAHRRKLEAEAELDREIRQKEAAALHKQMQETTAVVVNNLRAVLYDAAVAALESVRRNGKVVNRTALGLRNLADRLRALNLAGDAEMERYADIVQEMASGGERSAKEVEEKLRELAVVARGQLISLGQAPRSAREMDVPDRIDAGRVRQARAALGVGDDLVVSEDLRLDGPRAVRSVRSNLAEEAQQLGLAL